MNYHLKIITTILVIISSYDIGITSNITVRDPKVKNINQLHYTYT